MQQNTNNNQTMNTRNKKSFDGYINLKCFFTDGSGNQHPIKTPMFGLEVSNAVHAAILNDIDNLAQYITIEVESVRRAAPVVSAADINLNFASQVESAPTE